MNGAFQSNEIHVWRVEATDQIDDWVARLSQAEQDRAAKFRFAKDRRLFVTAHAALRSILAQYLSVSPLGIEFIIGGQGKPRLTPTCGTNIHFNLSHSSDRAVIAVASREVGVDVECIKDHFAFEEVAENFFTGREVAALRSLPSHLQRQAFYQCWTCKEAFLKAKGTGLSGELDEVQIIFDGPCARIDANVAGWSLKEIDAGAGHAAAVVSEGGPAEVRLYQWTP